MPFEDPLFNEGSGEFHGYKFLYRKEALFKLSIFNFGMCKLCLFLKLNIPIHKVFKIQSSTRKKAIIWKLVLVENNFS